MTGATLNAIGILLGGVLGLLRRGKGLPPQTEAFLKLALGVFAIFFGLQFVWLNISGSFAHCAKQFLIVILAVAIGKPAGKLIGLQRASNRLGQRAGKLIQDAVASRAGSFKNGIIACTILFCAPPLGIVGALQDGLSGYFHPLAVKAVMDGLAMMGFVQIFGEGCLLAAVPVFVLQAVITRAGGIYLEPFLRTHGLLESVNATGGIIICSVGLLILEIKKIGLADYLPALAFAPVLTWLWR